MYDKQTCRITPFSDPRLLNKAVDAITVDNAENVWISAGGKVYRCDSTAHVIKEYELGQPQEGYAISNIYMDQSKQLWAVGSRGIFRYEPETDSFFRYPPLGNGHTAYIMFQDKAGNYWICLLYTSDAADD